MCGRYASARSRIELLEEFDVQGDRVDESLNADYNVAPTKPVYAVMTRKPRAETDDAAAKTAATTTTDAKAERELRVVRWGLVPYWAKDVSIGSRLINARAETVSEKPAFRAAFAKRRCLLPADGYYEWQPPPPGTKGSKQPYFICRPDHSVLAFAGLYELWRDRSLPREDPGAWLWTATVITTSAPDELGEIHDRMPMVIDRASWTDWLDPGNTDVADVQALLAPAASTGLISYPVAQLVNSVRNNGPELIEQADPVAPGMGGRSDA
ncbi:MAG TPA: SOS response-associated peptidase [Streptosporangiaceae bacterium]|nr:SOS response-associated peptidase [Streptosporangiaceae bacterium]